MSLNEKPIKKKPSYGVLGVSRLQMPDFTTSILATCLRSVKAPKRVDRFLCGWWHWLAFLKLSMIRGGPKKSIDFLGHPYMSINQKLIKKKPSYGVLGVSRLQMPDFLTPISATCLRSVIAPKRIN